LLVKVTREERQNEIYKFKVTEYHHEDERAPAVKVDIGEVCEDIGTVAGAQGSRAGMARRLERCT
jgi:hypothetical protein